MKKFLSLLLALAMMLSLFACGGNADTESSGQPSSNAGVGDGAGDGTYVPVTYEEQVIYDMALSDFYNAFMKAKAADTISERYALMAIAEAKLLESGVLIPVQSNGGSYGLTHIVPRTIPTVMWGSDSDRLNSMIVVNELLKAEDRAEITALWAELAGTGTYEAEVKKLLEEKGYTFNDTLNYIYTADPTTWDTLSSWQSAQSEPVCFTVDGLVTYDMENELQPALAESWEVSDDELTYTFHIREGVQWVDSQGRNVGEVQADDWVASLQHTADSGDGQAAMFQAVEGMGDYLDGIITDFSQVGITAVDKYTLEYKLTEPVPYFMSILTYCGVASPLCRSYYESQGGKFGIEFDSGAADYTYGLTPNNIAYCGPFLITGWTAENSIVYEANPTYWNPDLLNVHKINWKFWDGQDVLQPYYDVVNGDLASIALDPSRLAQCQQDGYFEEYAVLSSTDGSTFNGYYNLNRVRYTNFNDETKGVSPKTHDSASEIVLYPEDESQEIVYTSDILDDAARWHSAINNQNFRLALTFAFDRGAYLAQLRSEELKYVCMRNSLVPATFVALEEDTTVSINGTSQTFPAGTWYGEIMQAQIDADGYPIKVWDPDGDDGVGSGDGFDGWYNVANAKEYIQKAVEELAAVGVEVSAENPIQMDIAYFSGNETYVNQFNAYKQCIEENLDGLVQVNLIGFADRTDYLYSSYYPTVGSDYNFDMSLASGWSADYADPGNYLETLVPPPDGTGYVTMSLGLW